MTDVMTERFRAWLLVVGFVGHAPGLKLLCRSSLPSAARRENLVAAIATLIAVGTAAMLGVDWQWLILIWLVGHFAWGARLTWILWRDTQS